MNAADDPLAIGVEDALSNCADYLREELALKGAAEQIDAAKTAVADLATRAQRMLPRNVCLTNTNVPDTEEVPLLATMGELRALAAALARVRGSL